MFTEPPADLVGQFDIVHVRLITLLIKDNNVLSAIKNLRKLLRMKKTCTPPPAPGPFFVTHTLSR